MEMAASNRDGDGFENTAEYSMYSFENLGGNIYFLCFIGTVHMLKTTAFEAGLP